MRDKGRMTFVEKDDGYHVIRHVMCHTHMLIELMMLMIISVRINNNGKKVLKSRLDLDSYPPISRIYNQ